MWVLLITEENYEIILGENGMIMRTGVTIISQWIWEHRSKWIWILTSSTARNPDPNGSGSLEPQHQGGIQIQNGSGYLELQLKDPWLGLTVHSLCLTNARHSCTVILYHGLRHSPPRMKNQRGSRRKTYFKDKNLVQVSHGGNPNF